jgi:hypothetical protein
MQHPTDGMAPYVEQADVDRAFADYERSRDVIVPRPRDATRDALLCVSCGSDDYTYNNTGWVESGARVCNQCGVVQPGRIIFDHMFGRTVPTRTSNYKRIHHWHERISQFMLMESRIPKEHMLAIGERIFNGQHAVLSKDTIRSVLRSLGMQVYIEKWLQIIERCTGVQPPCPGPHILIQLDSIFHEMQRPFDACKAYDRSNFLNYNFVFCRILQQMQCTKFCMFFPLIRSKPKLRALDDTWTKMAMSLGWQVPALATVSPFCVLIDGPVSSLLRLRAALELLAPVVPRPMSMKTGIQTWGHRKYQYQISEPTKLQWRSSRPEPRVQTIALKLKRKRSVEAAQPQS